MSGIAARLAYDPWRGGFLLQLRPSDQPRRSLRDGLVSIDDDAGVCALESARRGHGGLRLGGVDADHQLPSRLDVGEDRQPPISATWSDGRLELVFLDAVETDEDLSPHVRVGWSSGQTAIARLSLATPVVATIETVVEDFKG